jgi:hypothetical protein
MSVCTIIKSAIKRLPYLKNLFDERDRYYYEAMTLNGVLEHIGIDRPRALEDEIKAHHVLGHIAELINAKKCFFLTSSETGGIALNKVRASQFETFVSTRYSPEADIKNNIAIHQDMALAVSIIRQNGSFDISFVDPFHTYSESSVAIKEALACLNDNGWMVLHDCFPPYELTEANQQKKYWCGSTYAAFRDVVSATDRAWFVINTDFGLGIIGPKGTSPTIKDVVNPLLKSHWENADLAQKRDLFKQHGIELMRVLSLNNMDAALDAVINNGVYEFCN